MLDVSREVLSVVTPYLRNIRPTGPENVMAICPFHRKPGGGEERHPSFAMNIYTGVYFCHACQAKGNLWHFLRDIGMSRQIIQSQYSMLLDAARKNLPPPPNYLKPGVFEMEPLEEGLLGLFDGYDLVHLKEAGFTEQTLFHFEVGYDRWHERVTFPIRDIKGQVVAISGRSLNDGWPKYKIYDTEYETWNMPARLNWDKRKVLYNAAEVYPPLCKLSPDNIRIVVVEGFKAAMWLWQCGLKNVVALLGAYLSWEQRWILERLGGTVVLFLDNNYAGITGTLKAGEALLKKLDVQVVEYPDRLKIDDKSQPDSLTLDEVHEQLNRAPTYLKWLRTQSEGA